MDKKIAGLKLPYFIIALVIIVLSFISDVLPNGTVEAFSFLTVFGELLNLTGNHTPIIKMYLGDGVIVSIFVGAVITYYKWLPVDSTKSINIFMTKGGFLDFCIAALITGPILGMNRKLLIKTVIRYLPHISGFIFMALLLVRVVGLLFGKSVGESIAHIGIPIMGRGMEAGAVSISRAFESVLNIPSETILSKLVPAVALGNATAIVVGGLLNRLGKSKPSLASNGQLVRSDDDSLRAERKENIILNDVKDYGAGIVIVIAFFTFGAILAFSFEKIGTKIHSYAWMIISVVIVKATGIVPEKIEHTTEGRYSFVAKNFTAALMLGIGMAYTNLGQIFEAFISTYVVLVIAVVLGAIIGAGTAGHFVGLYPTEAAITAELCMVNMSSTGDVAVLTATDRMELMPFAQISPRSGGTLIILLASILVPVFF